MKMSKVDADFSVKTEGACFICYGREELRDLTTAYNNNGEEEIYSQIIHHCFNMQIAEVVGLSLLCSCCVEQLRAADTFRKQIQQAIDNFNSIKDFPENDDADEPYQESEGSDMDTSLQNIKLLLKKKNDKVEKAKKKNATILAQKSNIKEVFKEEKPKGEEGAKPKSRGRKDLSLSEKLRIIKEYEDLQLGSVSQRKAADQLGLPKSTLCKLLKTRSAIKTSVAGHNRKRQRDGKNKTIDEALLNWFLQERFVNDSIERITLKQKANELAVKLGQDFQATDGWLSRWKARHGICNRRMQKKNNAIQSTIEDKDNVYFLSCNLNQ